MILAHSGGKSKREFQNVYAYICLFNKKVCGDTEHRLTGLLTHLQSLLFRLRRRMKTLRLDKRLESSDTDPGESSFLWNKRLLNSSVSGPSPDTCLSWESLRNTELRSDACISMRRFEEGLDRNLKEKLWVVSLTQCRCHKEPVFQCHCTDRSKKQRGLKRSVGCVVVDTQWWTLFSAATGSYQRYHSYLGSNVLTYYASSHSVNSFYCHEWNRFSFQFTVCVIFNSAR